MRNLYLGRQFKTVAWISLVALAILINIASRFPGWVEHNYTYGIYPYISRFQRFLVGWLPFSVGDIIYAVVIFSLLFFVIRLIRQLIKKSVTRLAKWRTAKRLIFILLFGYVFFYLCWGLNYSRKGIAYQLGLDVKKASIAELDSLTGNIVGKLNTYAAQVDTIKRLELKSKKLLFEKTRLAYVEAAKIFPFLKYKTRSLKPSLYSHLGQYFGFTGYYNPFSGEAQVRTVIPVFAQPFISTHEVAHQLGYAKENEANFVSFLASTAYDDIDFRYSIYYDIYSYTISELARADLTRAMYYTNLVHVRVKRDRRELWLYYSKRRNPIEPLMSKVYDRYLVLNKQPKGKETYNEVVLWLIAYAKKYGWERI